MNIVVRSPAKAAPNRPTGQREKLKNIGGLVLQSYSKSSAKDAFRWRAHPPACDNLYDSTINSSNRVRVTMVLS